MSFRPSSSTSSAFRSSSQRLYSGFSSSSSSSSCIPKPRIFSLRSPKPSSSTSRVTLSQSRTSSYGSQRFYSPSTAYAYSDARSEHPIASTSSSNPESSSSNTPNTTPPQYGSTQLARSSTTPESAQAFISDLLGLPPDKAFPPSLALQCLTHKSYRFAHVPLTGEPENFGPPAWMESRRGSNFSALTAGSGSGSGSLGGSMDGNTTSSGDITTSWSARHNARLAFIGRRAFSTYMTMFIHASLRSGGLTLDGVELLNGKTFLQRMEWLRDTRILGRDIGEPWGVERLMRWDRNINAMRGGAVKVKGSVVEAILGATYSQFGSPAAQRLFHSQMLPLMAKHFRDPALKEKVGSMKDQVKADFGGSVLLP